MYTKQYICSNKSCLSQMEKDYMRHLAVGQISWAVSEQSLCVCLGSCQNNAANYSIVRKLNAPTPTSVGREYLNRRCSFKYQIWSIVFAYIFSFFFYFYTFSKSIFLKETYFLIYGGKWNISRQGFTNLATCDSQVMNKSQDIVRLT